MSRGIGGHQRARRGRTDTWLTPPWVIKALGPFDLDPCAAPAQPWPTAAVHFWDKGLEREWNGLVWLNPPYSEVGPWLKRLSEYPQGGMAMIFARTETKHFYDYVWMKASGVLFLHGRPHFHLPDGKRAKGNSGGPVCIVAYGSRAINRIKKINFVGTLVEGWRSRR